MKSKRTPLGIQILFTVFFAALVVFMAFKEVPRSLSTATELVDQLEAGSHVRVDIDGMMRTLGSGGQITPG
jgi:hypothetical protein